MRHLGLRQLRHLDLVEQDGLDGVHGAEVGIGLGLGEGDG